MKSLKKLLESRTARLTYPDRLNGQIGKEYKPDNKKS